MKLREWNARLHGLVVFRSLLDDPVVARLVDLTDRMEAGAPGYGPKPRPSAYVRLHRAPLPLHCRPRWTVNWLFCRLCAA